MGSWSARISMLLVSFEFASLSLLLTSLGKRRAARLFSGSG